jgi:hypothetical protein
MATRIRRDPSVAPLEYRLALDLAFAALPRSGGRDPSLLLVASAPLIIQEVCIRAMGPVTIVPDTPAALASAARLARADDIQRPSAIQVARREDPLTWAPGRHDAVIWASPRPATWRPLVSRVDSALAPGGRLATLVAGPLMRPLATLLADVPVGGPAWCADDLTRKLSRRGYELDDVYRFAGIKSVSWSVASRLAAVLGRHDLVDRAEAGYRAAIADAYPASVSRLRLAVLRKGVSSW